MKVLLTAIALLVTTSCTQAKTTELSCHETKQPERRWIITLNEDSGTGSLVLLNGRVLAANVPAIFTPDKVILKQTDNATVTIDRKTLAFRRTFMGSDEADFAGQCALAVESERKF